MNSGSVQPTNHSPCVIPLKEFSFLFCMAVLNSQQLSFPCLKGTPCGTQLSFRNEAENCFHHTRKYQLYINHFWDVQGKTLNSPKVEQEKIQKRGEISSCMTAS